MNRIIKFRGKSIFGGEWLYGCLVNMEHNRFSILPEINKMPRCKCIADYEIHNTTIGQFTGMKDKNGKEIYEGDILGAKGKVIGWVKGGVRGYCYDVVYINHPAGESRWTLYSTVKDDYPEQIEVIGNIYDNPELLKGGAK